MSNVNYDEQHINERNNLLAQIEKDQEQLLELQDRYQKNVKKLELLNQLINVDQGKESKKFEEYLAEIIKTSSVPMHINEIYKELIQRKVPIPGRGSLENVVTRLTRAKEMFVREGTGTYSLVEKGSENISKAGSKLVEKGGDSISKARTRFSKTRKEDNEE